MWKVEIISTENIKPSSPTPHHLQNFKLSLLDQLAPTSFVLLLLYYTPATKQQLPNDQKHHHLKTSLSQTLVRFYTLAGRFKEEDDIIDCNDEGAEYTEARISGELSEFLREPDVEILNDLLPCDTYGTRSGRDVMLAIQTNIFDCGGIAIGVGLFHKAGDAASLSTFVNAWAGTACGISKPMAPSFDSVSVFPPRKGAFSVQVGERPKEKVVTKRFLFSQSNIADLRNQANGFADHSKVGYPTRVEAVSALIWQCAMKARGETGSTRASVAVHTVNIRGRMVPPLPENSFGNLYVPAITSVLGTEYNDKMKRKILEKKLRDAIREVDIEFVRSLQGPDGVKNAHKSMEDVVEKYSECGMDFCIFTSWCRFPFYEVDFGWGKPIWVSSCNVLDRNVVYLIGTRKGDGIEAWVCMEEEEMRNFEQDSELLPFVSSPTIA